KEKGNRGPRSTLFGQGQFATGIPTPTPTLATPQTRIGPQKSPKRSTASSKALGSASFCTETDSVWADPPSAVNGLDVEPAVSSGQRHEMAVEIGPEVRCPRNPAGRNRSHAGVFGGPEGRHPRRLHGRRAAGASLRAAAVG